MPYHPFAVVNRAVFKEYPGHLRTNCSTRLKDLLIVGDQTKKGTPLLGALLGVLLIHMVNYSCDVYLLS